eukprot:7048193-Pyramimonas_sp.AAC.1
MSSAPRNTGKRNLIDWNAPASPSSNHVHDGCLPGETREPTMVNCEAHWSLLQQCMGTWTTPRAILGP